jgi:hypothetical protein
MTRDRLAWGRSRRVALFVWTGFLSLLFGLIFTGVPVLTIATWLAGQNHDTTPVTDLGFFALGGVIITAGLVAQLREPKRRIAGVQQSIVGILALGVAGLVGDRIEPLVRWPLERRTYCTFNQMPHMKLARPTFIAIELHGCRNDNVLPTPAVGCDVKFVGLMGIAEFLLSGAA